MFWAGITFDRRTELVIVPRPALTAARYVSDILDEHVRPFAETYGENFLFMHDNARPHTARNTQEYLDAEGIVTLATPARSPDCNPIEHVWDMLKRRIRAHVPAPEDLHTMERVAIAEWANIPQIMIKNTIISMRRRMLALIKARGGHTRY